MNTCRASNYEEWQELGLLDFTDFSDFIEYVNERESGYGDSEGEWWCEDAETLTIYHGTHSNDHSPGASAYTYADIYDNTEEYAAAVAEWQAKPEYLEEGPSEPEEDDYVTADHLHWSQNGKLAFTGSIEALQAHMEQEGFYPNCWFISDHGNIHLLEIP